MGDRAVGRVRRLLGNSFLLTVLSNPCPRKQEDSSSFFDEQGNVSAGVDATQGLAHAPRSLGIF